MKLFYISVLLCVCVAVTSLGYLNPHALLIKPAYAEGKGTTVKEIRINGVQRIEPETVLTYMDIQVGDKLTKGKLDNALKNLFVTGLFADVSFEQKGSLLNVNIVENPIVNKVVFEGNDELVDTALQAEIQLRQRQIFTRTKVQEDVNRLYQLYRRNGRFAAKIDPKVIKLDQNRIDLVFEIEEGEVTKVQSIRFIGNKKYSDDKLRSEISTSEKRWYKFLSTSDRYDPDRIAFDEELLRRFYLSQGYADFNIISSNAELSKDQEYFFVTFTIEEGRRYKVERINVNTKIEDIDTELLRRYLTVEVGDWYNADEVKTSTDKLTEALGDMQFAFVKITPDVLRDRKNRTINLSFNISETQRTFVERIEVKGNSRTLDRVIRREMRLVEGDPFNRSALAESEGDINDLGYFETVTVDTKQGSAPDKTVIDINVAEKSTGELSIGAGFSTSDGPLADLRITERNFLGKGQKLQFATTLAGERTEFDVGFTEPYFLDRDFSAGFDVFHMTRDLQEESSFDQRRTGGALRFGYPVSENVRQVVRYRIERNDITDVASDASTFIQQQEGERITSAISQRISYDNRDSIIFPTNGLSAWLFTELAGLGGDAKFVSGTVGASYFYPVADQWVLNVAGETGAITAFDDSEVRINERFFLGGSSLRGFADSGVGPRDEVTNDSFGGNYFYRTSAELSFPIGLPEELGVQGHVFTDAGSLWSLDNEAGFNVQDENSIRAAAGVGVSWRSPFGPIRMNWSQPYVSESFDQEETFRFDFGTRF